MYYFYYFKDTQTNLYYGGITNNILKRQMQHRKDLKLDLRPVFSEFNCSTEIHKQLSEAGGSFKAKMRYALEVNNPEIIYTFSSAVKASKFTEVHDGALVIF